MITTSGSASVALAEIQGMRASMEEVARALRSQQELLKLRSITLLPEMLDALTAVENDLYRMETILDNEGRDGWAVDSIVTELTEVVVGAESTSHEARRLRVVFRRPATEAAVTESAVSISGFAFQPPTLAVAPGTTVTWTNEDGAPHTVTSDDGTFDSGELGSGGTFSTSFAEAGTFAYSCRFHPGMTGTIVVG